MTSATLPPRKVGVLGCTGSVGQRFILLLASHPSFTLTAIGASPRSAGHPYAFKVSWKQTSPIPASAAALIIKTCEPANFADCDIVFSGLDADVAGPIETSFLEAGLTVFSNSKNHRRDPITPLMVPLVNTHHFGILDHQRKQRKGTMVTNANCSTTGLVVPLKALIDKFGPLEAVTVTTLQAISGGGYPGVPSFDVLDNVVPYIGGEEEKIEWETGKILAELNEARDEFVHTEIKVSAQCNRVPVIDGHTACVSVKFAKQPAPSVEEIKQAFREFKCEAQELGAPSAPKQAIIVRDEPDRPQPRLDRESEGGYAVVVGRIREDPVLDVKFVGLSHNTVIGAAGSSILNAEVGVLKGLI
ncbi:aspartate-semialdehyde dehydrogenase [Ascodesmis nigricans]|uniref:Aspartate-semialdehyde dehydrogenase n=1 Tax=Ascodesmis nigricans TaxID=341454 RepID=A0A4V3SJ92_9PEZI|nr:aspartate-semialdehyde dehydrogenase [Ascodesmis nigricans]